VTIFFLSYEHDPVVQGGIGLDEVTTEDVEYREGLTATSTLLAICTEKVGPRSSRRKNCA